MRSINCSGWINNKIVKAYWHWNSLKFKWIARLWMASKWMNWILKSKFWLSLIIEKSITSSLQLWRVSRVIAVFILFLLQNMQISNRVSHISMMVVIVLEVKWVQNSLINNFTGLGDAVTFTLNEPPGFVHKRPRKRGST